MPSLAPPRDGLLADYNQPTTVYLVIPPGKIETYGRYLRGVLGAALLAVESHVSKPRHPVLFMLDEVAQLGCMPKLRDAASYIAGSGALLWFVIQDLSQLRSAYGDGCNTILNNTIMHAYAPHEVETAEHLERLLGKTTVEVRSHGKSRGRGTQGASSNVSQQARSLLTADEIRRLPSDQVLVFERGQPPQRLKRLNYLEDPEYRGLAEKNPMYSAVGEDAEGGGKRGESP